MLSTAPVSPPLLNALQQPGKLAPGEQFRLAIERMHAGHQVTLLLDGGAAYPAMLEAIVQATASIELETYLWASDENGHRFLDALCIKAQEGVRIRVVIDGAGSWGFSGDDVRRLAAAGVQLSIFHPVGPWRRRWGWQIRDHRKLLVIDGRIAFTGGMNLGNDYASRDWGGRGWRDVHARIVGPVVGELLRLFEMTWRYAEPETWEAPKRLPPPRHAHVEQAAISTSATRVQALAIGRWLGRRVIQRHLQQAIGAARRTVWLEAAYFIPTRALRRALRNAARRGVDVRVMVPRQLDVPGLGDASRYTWASLLKDGVRILEWLPSMLHAKTIAIDSEWCSLGSYNLDQRSLRYNWELAVSIADPEIARQLEARFESALPDCCEVNEEEWKRRGLFRRVRERFFYFFRLWL